jgi:type IV pilus assembly protein PilC
MQFSYKAVKDSGEVITGTSSAESEEALYAELKESGMTLISATTKQARSFSSFFSGINARIGRIKEEEKIIFARNLGAMIGAGLPIGRALSVLERQTKNEKFKLVLRSLDESIKAGQPLSVALAVFPDVFPPLFVSMVRAGEESGNLVDSLKSISSQMEQTYKLKKKIRGAMMYPAIILFAMVIIAILMLIFVIPTLTATFEELNVDLPMSTQVIIAVSNFLQENTLISLGLLIGVFVGGGYLLRTKPGKRFLDTVFLKVPIISPLVKEVNSSRTAGTLASLLRAGVEVVSAIEITKDIVQNSYYKEILEEVRISVEKGDPMSEVFKNSEHLYPPLVGEMVSVGEETGKLSELLAQISIFYDEDVDQKTKDMSAIIEPFLMVIIGAVVGFFAISMISPMYSLTNSF